ncbi:hypothetical protein I6F35_07945 [Bradyrhizobium sp. BRP22]|uniref:hypothetical protein n=1 Tax=Bradyrhizobium sp. BRP22 TaxID=2793821 RepID=UPI001CD64842|nr:hypothetical protein [Bradyrhizobium sp. BRP22]MCA1453152.1 hypothetical protein [Bradyrhizobium sp. BRP22]
MVATSVPMLWSRLLFQFFADLILRADATLVSWLLRMRRNGDTVLDYLWTRFLRELGLVRHISPVISVAESSSCDAERLPWGELQGRPRAS